MNILIVGGKEQADFLIDSLLSKKHNINIINQNEEYCRYLSEKYDIPVFYNDLTRESTFNDISLKREFDVLIALTESDADNLAICQYAKKVLKIKRVVCTVNNPKNVEVFKMLGITNVISATYMVSKYIEQQAMIDSLTKMLSEEDNVQILQIIIKEQYECCFKYIKDIGLPSTSKIGVILRNGRMIVPGGNTKICPNDKLFMITNKDTKDKAVEVIQK